MKKTLKLLNIADCGGIITFSIDEQSHRGDEFGAHGNDKFKSSKGFIIKSASYPEMSRTSDCLYVRGYQTVGDNDTIQCTTDQWIKILEAVDEYNKFFSGEEKVENTEFVTTPIKFDISKPAKTRDGKEVKIYAVYPDERKIHGAFNEDGWNLVTWSIDGSYDIEEHDLDLVNIPIKHKGWINIYGIDDRRTAMSLYSSKEMADECATSDRVACIKITWEDGEGL